MFWEKPWFFERNLDVTRETKINKFRNGNCYWVTFTSLIGPIGLVRILVFPQVSVNILFETILELLKESDLIYIAHGFYQGSCLAFVYLTGSFIIGTCLRDELSPMLLVVSLDTLVSCRCCLKDQLASVWSLVLFTGSVGVCTSPHTLNVSVSFFSITVCFLGLSDLLGQTGIVDVLVEPFRVLLLVEPGESIYQVFLSF